MHNDEPTLNDSLDRKLLIKEVGDAIASCTPPQVFGIHGDWGLGKTSFLHQVQWYITGDCPQQSSEQKAAANSNQIDKGKYENMIRTVWFDAWRYQDQDAPVVALLQEMREQLSWGHQITAATKRTVEISVRGALLSMDELTKKIGVFQYSKFRDATREWEIKNQAIALPSHTLRELLRDAIRQLLPKPSKNALEPRLTIFIDDVDRCEPEFAYRLLEGLKIYLTLDNCVVVLGMNQKTVENALGSRMPGETGESPIKSRAAAYMEKLCQNVWQLPAIRNTGQVLRLLLEDTVEREDVRNWIEKAVEEFPCLPPNPRRLKGLANLIGRLSNRFPEKPKSSDAAVIEAQILVIVAYIYQFHSDLYIRWEAEPDLYKIIYDWCDGGERDFSFLNSLVLPQHRVEADKEPLPSTIVKSTYPDPTESNVFWIQSLILSLGSEVGPKQFEPYLHSRTK